MSLVFRVIWIMIALSIAIVVAGIALAAGIAAPDWRGIDSDPVERVSFFVFTFFTTSFVAIYSMFPAFLAIILAESLRVRSFLYYGVCGALIGLIGYFGSNIGIQLENTTDISPVTYSLQLVAASGIIGGLAYWLLAGRNAGRWRDTL